MVDQCWFSDHVTKEIVMDIYNEFNINFSPLDSFTIPMMMISINDIIFVTLNTTSIVEPARAFQ